jgi:hypothetical protein
LKMTAAARSIPCNTSIMEGRRVHLPLSGVIANSLKGRLTRSGACHSSPRAQCPAWRIQHRLPFLPNADDATSRAVRRLFASQFAVEMPPNFTTDLRYISRSSLPLISGGVKP